MLEAVADGRLSGGTTHVLQLIAALREHFEVHLVSQAGTPALAGAAARGATPHGMDFFTSRLDPRVWLGLRELVRRLRPALVHAHGARAGLPLSAACAQRPMLYSVHGYHFVGKSGLARRLGILAERRCSARAQVTVFVAAHDRAVAERHGILQRCRAHRVIPNGIDLEELPHAAGGDGRTLAYLGRLSEEKNPLLIPDLLDRLRDLDMRAVVIGDGPLMPAMRQRAVALDLAERVDFRGALPREQALQVLAGCAALLVPSLWEGLPLAPLEAMGMGVPVIASKVGGLPEIIEDGVSGLLVARPDPSLFAVAVRGLHGDPQFRQALTAAARERVRTRFSWADARSAYLHLYDEVLDRT